MAYGNPFNYQQPYYMQVPQQQIQPVAPYQPQTSQSQNMIWVQGDIGAKSFLVSPNTTVPLWDSEAHKIYLKSADASGMPTTKVLNYTIEEQSLEQSSQGNTNTNNNQPVVVNNPEYVTKADLEEFGERLIKQMNETGYNKPRYYNKKYNKEENKGDE